jgi:hypothetical protein
VQTILELKTDIIRRALLIGILLAAGALFFKWQLSLGILAGSLISIFNFHLIYKRVLKITSVSGSNFMFAHLAGYIFRYALMALALYLAIKIDFFLFVGLAAGLFMIRVTIYLKMFKQTRCRT